jgi:hypothetical protein
MIISDLNYLESAESSDVKGALGNVLSTQINWSAIGQSSSANAGNIAGLSLFNLAASSNTANVTQVNL